MDIQLRSYGDSQRKLEISVDPLICTKIHSSKKEKSSCDVAKWNFADFLKGPWLFSGKYDLNDIQVSVIDTCDILLGPTGFCMKYDREDRNNCDELKLREKTLPDFKVRKYRTSGLQDLNIDRRMFIEMSFYEGITYIFYYMSTLIRIFFNR